MKWEHTEYFSPKLCWKENLSFQSYDIFFGKCTGPTIVKLDKIKRKVETIPPQIENCRIPEISWRMEEATLENVAKIIPQEKKK